jgi:hypothetical protein
MSLCELFLRLVQTCGLPMSICRFRWSPDPFIAQGWAVTQRPRARQVALRWLYPILELGYYWLGVANDDSAGNISYCHIAKMHMVSSMESSYCITTVDSTRGGQQPMVAGGCTIVTCWHITMALLVIVASVKCMCPLLATVALSGACAPWERVSLKCITEPTVTSFIFEARNPQRAMGHMVAPEPSLVERLLWSHGTHHSAVALLSREVGPELCDTWQRWSPP